MKKVKEDDSHCKRGAGGKAITGETEPTSVTRSLEPPKKKIKSQREKKKGLCDCEPQSKLKDCTTQKQQPTTSRLERGEP